MSATKFIDQLAVLIQKWAAIFDITDYKFRINVGTDKQLRGNYAEVNTDEETREVVLDFNQTRLNKEPEEIEKTVVHELLHTRFNEYTEFISDTIDSHIRDPKTRNLLKKQLDRMEHKIVVALTDAFTRKE